MAGRHDIALEAGDLAPFMASDPLGLWRLRAAGAPPPAWPPRDWLPFQVAASPDGPLVVDWAHFAGAAPGPSFFASAAGARSPGRSTGCSAAAPGSTISSTARRPTRARPTASSSTCRAAARPWSGGCSPRCPAPAWFRKRRRSTRSSTSPGARTGPRRAGSRRCGRWSARSAGAARAAISSSSTPGTLSLCPCSARRSPTCPGSSSTATRPRSSPRKWRNAGRS